MFSRRPERHVYDLINLVSSMHSIIKHLSFDITLQHSTGRVQNKVPQFCCLCRRHTSINENKTIERISHITVGAADITVWINITCMKYIPN